MPKSAKVSSRQQTFSLFKKFTLFTLILCPGSRIFLPRSHKCIHLCPKYRKTPPRARKHTEMCPPAPEWARQGTKSCPKHRRTPPRARKHTEMCPPALEWARQGTKSCPKHQKSTRRALDEHQTSVRSCREAKKTARREACRVVFGVGRRLLVFLLCLVCFQKFLLNV